eukprot:298232_1
MLHCWKETNIDYGHCPDTRSSFRTLDSWQWCVYYGHSQLFIVALSSYWHSNTLTITQSELYIACAVAVEWRFWMATHTQTVASALTNPSTNQLKHSTIHPLPIRYRLNT